MKETEITVQVLDDIQVVRDRLLELGFECKETYYMTDWYYSRYDTAKLLGMKYIDILNNSFIIREICDPIPRCDMVYKKKLLDDQDNVIQEEKFKAGVDSSESINSVLAMSGLNNWCIVRNDSEIYVKGDMELAVQVIDNLGLFIEYEESASMSDLTEVEKFDLMVEQMKSLGLNLDKDFSAKKVYMKFLKENGQQ